MLKLLTTLALLVVIAIIATIFYINLYGADYAADYLSKLIKLPVSIEKVEVSWRHLSLKHVDIKNRSQTAIASTFKADLVQVNVKPFDLLKNIIPIHEVAIENAIIGIEMKNFTGSENNWEGILNTLFSYSSPLDPKKVVINKLCVKDLSIQAKHQMFGAYSIILPVIPRIDVDKLTANTPLTIPEALNIIFRAILTPISEKEGFGQILDKVDEMPPSIKAIFSQQETTVTNPDGTKKFSERVDEVLEELGGFFKDLFGNSKQPQPSR